MTTSERTNLRLAPGINESGTGEFNQSFEAPVSNAIDPRFPTSGN